MSTLRRILLLSLTESIEPAKPSKAPLINPKKACAALQPLARSPSETSRKNSILSTKATQSRTSTGLLKRVVRTTPAEPPALLRIPRKRSIPSAANKETRREQLETGFRTDRDALLEFKHIKSNEYSGGVRKHKFDVEGDEPCVCAAGKCDLDCLNRSMQIECNPKLCPVELKKSGACRNDKFVRAKRCKVKVKESMEKGCGLYAEEKIAKGMLAVEYVGEVVDEKECDRRLGDDYGTEKHKYLMCMNGGLVIDATRRGNVARFVNHSCDPNCVVQEWKVRGESRMGIFATKDIAPGEELAFDYNFQRFGEATQQCHCGAVKCRRLLGRNKEEESENSKKRMRKPGVDPILNDYVGPIPDLASLRKSQKLILSMKALVRVGMDVVPRIDRDRAKNEGIFLSRNATTTFNKVYRGDEMFVL